MLKATLGKNNKGINANIGHKNSGLSAYEVWLAAGNVGTVEEFLDSLKADGYILTEDDKKEIARQAAEMVEIPEIPDVPEGVATEDWVKDYAQPKGSYVTEGQLQKAVEDAVKDLDFDMDLDGYATTEQLKQVEEKIPDQLADLQDDSNHRTVTDTEKQSWNSKSTFSGNYNDLQNKPTSLPASDVADWAKQPDKPTYTKNDVGLDKVANERQYSANNPPPYPVTSVNGQTGAVDVEPKGTGAQKVAEHNTSDAAHSDIRLILENLITKVNTLLDSDDTTLDQTKEIVAYIKANRGLIESVTTSKVNVSDIIDNLTTSAADKPLSAKQGVQLKSLIDAIKVPTKLSELSGDSTHRTVTDSEKNSWNNKSDFSGKYEDLQGRPTKVSAFTNDAGYMKSSEQQTVIDTALAQAKASGEFDGKDGRSIFITTSPAHENPDDDNIYEFNTSAINTNGRKIQINDLIICLHPSQEFEVYQVGSIISGYVQCSYLGKLKGDKGTDGQRGFSILKVTTAPSSYTTATGGFTPTYRIALSTVKTQSKATEVLVGDTLAYNYYQYPVGYVDGSYVYLGARTSIRGAAYTLTDADKETIVNAVIQALPVYAGEVV